MCPCSVEAARSITAVDPNAAGLWISQVRRVFAGNVNHIIRWLAHRVQRPHEKINHALVPGGKQGIGKGSMLEPVKACRRLMEFRRGVAAERPGQISTASSGR
jgi:hypothetical protein